MTATRITIKKAIFLSFIIATLTGCNDADKDGIIRLDLTKSLSSDIPAAETLVSALSEVFFTKVTDIMLGTPRFFYADDQKYGIYDDTRILFINADTGEVLSEFDRSGRGPQEYVRASNVSFQNSTVCISDGNTRRAQFYTMDGEYLNTKDLPETCDYSFFSTDGSALIYPNYTGKRFDLFRGEEKVNEFVCEDDITGNPISSIGTISKFNDEHFFCTLLTDTLYRVTYDNVEPYLFLDKGQYTLPHDSRGKLDAGDGCITDDYIRIAGNFGFVSFYYRLPQREIWDIDSRKIIFKTTFSENNLDPGIPVIYKDTEIEFWPIYCSGHYLYDIYPDEDSTVIVRIKVQS